MQTNAVVFKGVDQIEMLRIEMPPPGPNEVQVKTDYSTISAGTEGWCLQNLFTWAPTPYPVVPGYQRVGTIIAVGPGVHDSKVGERVLATVGCWKGTEVKPFWGSHAAVCNTMTHEIYKIPAGCDDVDASAAVTAQVGYNAGYRPMMHTGDWFVVYGDGIIGQFGAQAARSRGAKVVLVGRRPERLQAASKAGIEATVNARSEDVISAVRRITGRQTVTVVIDTVQTVEAQKQYVNLLENWTGQIVYSGFTPGTCWADMALLQQRQLTCHNVSGWTRDRIDATLALAAAGRLSLRPLLTHFVPSVRGAEMYYVIRRKSEPFVAITLDWTKEKM